jgi:hypothetical protein
MSTWIRDLHDFFYKENEKKALQKKGTTQSKLRLRDYVENVASPAFDDVQDELRKYVEVPEIKLMMATVAMHFFYHQDYLIYKLRFRIAEEKVIPLYELDQCVNGKVTKVVKGHIRADAPDTDITEIQSGELIEHLITQFKNFIKLSNAQERK